MTIHTYETHKIPLVALLVMHGNKIISIDRTDPMRVEFSFNFNQKVQQLLNDFQFGNLTVEPKTFYEHLQKAKKYVHQSVIEF